MTHLPQDFRLVEDFYRTRRSVRKFIDRPVEEEKLMAILEAGRIAPSAHNYQPWHFLVVRDEEARKRLAPCSQQPWFPGAPTYIIVLGDHDRAWKRGAGDSVDIDTSIAMTYMMLEAHSLGLGATWVCAFDQALCSEIFEIPAHMTPISILAFGYGDPTVPPRETFNRKALKEIVSFEKL